MTNPVSFLARSGKKQAVSSGLSHWLGQRISALGLIPFSLWFLIELGQQGRSGYGVVREWIMQPWIGLALALFLTLIFYHNALGLQTIAEDYVPHKICRKLLIRTIWGISLVLGILSWNFIAYIIITGSRYSL